MRPLEEQSVLTAETYQQLGALTSTKGSIIGMYHHA